MASVASHQNKDVKPGDNIMVAGLAFQVFTLLMFIILCSDFAIRTLRRMKTLGSATALDPTHAKLRASWSFQGFLCALALATLCIFIRSTYRVAELGEGWEGALIKTQSLFIGLEGVMVIIACLVLNAFHPEWCFREGYDKKVLRNVKDGSIFFKRGGKKSNKGGSEREGKGSTELELEKEKEVGSEPVTPPA